MSRARHQLRLIARHKKHGGWWQAVSFAACHWRWWRWTEDEERYTHIGKEK